MEDTSKIKETFSLENLRAGFVNASASVIGHMDLPWKLKPVKTQNREFSTKSMHFPMGTMQMESSDRKPFWQILWNILPNSA